MTMPLVIAVDGPAASGKGTICRALAAAYDLAWLDTGLLYRAVALGTLGAGATPADAAAALAAAEQLANTADVPARLADPRLRDRACGAGASVVAAMAPVRACLVQLQRDFAQHPPNGRRGAVLDGRDIGTVICPTAAVKFFVTASLEERARRRVRELQQRGEAVSEAEIMADLAARDARDQGRAAAPLRQADDAMLLDTTSLDAAAAVAAAIQLVATRLQSLS